MKFIWPSGFHGDCLTQRYNNHLKVTKQALHSFNEFFLKKNNADSTYYSDYINDRKTNICFILLFVVMAFNSLYKLSKAEINPIFEDEKKKYSEKNENGSTEDGEVDHSMWWSVYLFVKEQSFFFHPFIVTLNVRENLWNKLLPVVRNII